jgi:hypothetical protein
MIQDKLSDCFQILPPETQRQKVPTVTLTRCCPQRPTAHASLSFLAFTPDLVPWDPEQERLNRHACVNRWPRM